MKHSRGIIRDPHNRSGWLGATEGSPQNPVRCRCDLVREGNSLGASLCSDPSHPTRSLRSGYSILEMVVAMILLGTVMSIVVPTLGWMSVQNRLGLQRQEALNGLQNLMDELTTRPYGNLTPEAAQAIELPAALKRQLPGARLQVEITEVKQAEPNAKRIRIELGWNQRNGQPLAPMRLTAWVHPREGQP